MERKSEVAHLTKAEIAAHPDQRHGLPTPRNSPSAALGELTVVVLVGAAHEASLRAE
jgi:hypothetical protein